MYGSFHIRLAKVQAVEIPSIYLSVWYMIWTLMESRCQNGSWVSPKRLQKPRYYDFTPCNIQILIDKLCLFLFIEESHREFKFMNTDMSKMAS